MGPSGLLQTNMFDNIFDLVEENNYAFVTSNPSAKYLLRRGEVFVDNNGSLITPAQEKVTTFGMKYMSTIDELQTMAGDFEKS